MVYITIGLFLLVLCYRDWRMEQERRHWHAERRELLNRVQRPEFLPNLDDRPMVYEIPDPDEIEKVGMILEPASENGDQR